MKRSDLINKTTLNNKNTIFHALSEKEIKCASKERISRNFSGFPVSEKNMLNTINQCQIDSKHLIFFQSLFKVTKTLK